MFLKSILLIVLLIIITSSESIDEQFLSKIKEIFKNKISKYPPDYNKYIKDIKIDLDLIYTKDENLIKSKCDGDKICIKQVDDAKIFDKGEWNKTLPSNDYLLNSVYYSLFTIRIEKKVMFLFITAKHKGNVIVQKGTYRYKKCERILFIKKCYFINKVRPRAFNIKEKQIINKALELTRTLEIIDKLNKLK